MTADEVDAYLAGLEEPKRSTLEALRRSIRAVVPDAEEGTSYGMPAFRVGGKVVAGFAAFKNHLAYLPHSGEVLPGLGERLTGYECTKGSLHFPVDEPLPDDLVRSLVDAKLEILRR
ncbi:MAG: iron chaperone [Nocardioidaceae bacterium]